MERDKLERDIWRYGNILRFVTDDRTVAVVSEMLAETRDRLNKMDQSAATGAETGATPSRKGI
jgi:hypothetical protein